MHPIASAVNAMNSRWSTKRVTRLSAGACILLLTGSIASAEGQSGGPSIQTQILGSFNGAGWTVPAAINNRGDVVGTAFPTGTTAGQDAFYWTEQTGFELIASDAVATDINNRGDVTGYRLECTEYPWGSSCSGRGFLWNSLTGFTDLGDFVPAAINNRGDMAGTCSGQACAIVRGVRTVWTCELPDCGDSVVAINDRGDAVGMRASPDFELAMLYPRRGEPVVLGRQTAEDINDAGTIAGRAPTAVWPSNATLWTKHGMVQAPDTHTSVAMSINARGWAAGVQFGSGEEGNQAFFWDGTAETLLLLATDAVWSEAVDLNARGQVVGFADTGNSRSELVIWEVRP
jgi:uncharacterized membrane protein